MRVFTVFHPTPFCNLACRYCWAPDKDNTARMPLGVVEKTLKQLYANPEVTKNDVLWLTGEPLVMGLSHFEEAVARCKALTPPGLSPRFIVQTNGTLIDPEWAAFFREHDFIVGVTVDGPQEVHDQQRITRRGGGTYDDTMKGIELLTKAGVRGGALCVITRRTLEIAPDRLFRFFQDRHISWSYLVEARIGDNVGSPDALSLEDGPRLRAFLGRLMTLWGQHPSSYIRDFDQLARRLAGRVGCDYDYTNLGCLDILNVRENGDYFWGNPELMSAMRGPLSHACFNLDQEDVWASRNTQRFLEVEAEIHRGIAKCERECPYFLGCQGGNPAHKYYQHGTFDASVHVTCQLNDQVLPHLILECLGAADPHRSRAVVA